MTSEKVEVSEREYPRFRIGARLEHLILLISFTMLVVTGLPQKYAETTLGVNFIDFFGGIRTIRIIHHWFAFILVLGSVYHILTASYRFFVKRERMGMVPDKKDLTDLKDAVAYNLGLAEDHPKMRKFNFGEKFEYWAVVWGTAVMAITGLMLLNPVATTKILPGEIIPAALAAHGNEALLATLAIIIWHVYNVHVKHLNLSIFTGRMPRNQMKEEHALELERLEQGGKPWPELDLPTLQHRRRNFIIASLIFGAIAMAIVVWAFTFEETAIETVPVVTRDVFVPLVTSTPIP
ncbi:MAG: formate dehydrogenase subunit gamma [Candidatus Promineifilaceae bacterium]